jgi:hypothetical protein
VPTAHRADNYYAAGNRIDIAVPVDADVIIAGRTLNIDQPVAGDIAAAGWQVAMRTHAGDDVRLAGANVIVDGPVDGDLTVAGGDVTIGPHVVARGRAWLTGGTVRVEGTFERQVRIAGGTVQIAGELREPLYVMAEKFEILPTARILAPVTYKGPVPAQIGEGATVSAPISFEQITTGQARRERWPSGASTILFTLHLIIAGLVFQLVLPRLAQPAADTLGAEPGRSALIGFVLLVTVPVAAFLLVVSVLGLPVGLSLGALYLVALLFGVVTTAIYIGELEARWLKFGPVTTRRQQVGALAVGVLTLAVLRTIPFVGAFVVLFATLFGVGALSLWLYRALGEGVPGAPSAQHV